MNNRPYNETMNLITQIQPVRRFVWCWVQSVIRFVTAADRVSHVEWRKWNNLMLWTHEVVCGLDSGNVNVRKLQAYKDADCRFDTYMSQTVYAVCLIVYFPCAAQSAPLVCVCVCVCMCVCVSSVQKANAWQGEAKQASCLNWQI